MRNRQQQQHRSKINNMNNDDTISHCNNDSSTRTPATITTNYVNENISNTNDTDVRQKIVSMRYMTAANALHFTSYECSRVSIMALLTSKNMFGYYQQSASIVSFATGCVGPFSIVLLYYYNYMFTKYGPGKSLYYSTIIFSFYIGCIGIVLDIILTTNNNTNYCKTIVRTLLFITYIIINSFVQLFFTQHWSFITSIFHTNTKQEQQQQTKQQESNSKGTLLVASNYFPIISGIASISATIVGYIISQQYIQQLLFTSSLPRILILSSFLMILCGYCSNQAYYYSSNSNNSTLNDFLQQQPSQEGSKNNTHKELEDDSVCDKSSTVSNIYVNYQQQKQKYRQSSSSSGTGTGTSSSITSVYQRTRTLFRRVPILYILCQEVFICQAVSSIISYIFVSTTKRILYTNDIHRATYTGNVYATINFGSGILEFFVLPSTLKYIQNKKVTWYSMPIIIIVLASIILVTPSTTTTMTITTTTTTTTTTTSINGLMIHDNNNYSILYIVTIAFITMKIFEYSIRGIMTEMVYTTLDYESRYFGKEVVGLVANRFGKSISALTIAIVSMKYSSTSTASSGATDIENFDTKTAPQLLIVTSVIWLYISTVAANQIEASSRNAVVEENKKNL